MLEEVSWSIHGSAAPIRMAPAAHLTLTKEGSSVSAQAITSQQVAPAAPCKYLSITFSILMVVDIPEAAGQSTPPPSQGKVPV